MKSWIAELVEEEILSNLYMHETNTEFIERICSICLDEIESNKGYAPTGFGDDVIEEIEQEVTEILKIKTYGHYNLQAYRKNHMNKRGA